MSRDAPPPLPGGYKVGEKVFYTGISFTFESGGATHKYVYGQQGEVVGPGTDDDGEEGVSVHFPDNEDGLGCPLAEVRRLQAASAAHLPPARIARSTAHAPSAHPPGTAIALVLQPPLQAQLRAP